MITVLMCLLACLCLAVVSGIAADCYVNILTQPDHILAFWARFLYRLRDKYVHRGQPDPITWAQRQARADYWLKPILTCQYCVAGQIAFWVFLYAHRAYNTNYSIIFHLLTAAISVWMAGIATDLRNRAKP